MTLRIITNNIVNIVEYTKQEYINKFRKGNMYILIHIKGSSNLGSYNRDRDSRRNYCF